MMSRTRQRGITLAIRCDTHDNMENKYRWLWGAVVVLIAALGFCVGYQDREQIGVALRQVGMQVF